MKDDALPSPVQSPLLTDKAGNCIRHGYFTREGGVSEGLYRGLNVGLGSNDARERVEENRARVSAWFGADVDRLATVHQVHSPDAIVVDAGYDGARPQADALVTATPGLVLGVLSADCGPVLFADPQAGVIGAAHAGWKGALTGVLENTIDAMVALGAERERIVACLGPSISRRNYEVGAEFVERFLEKDPAYAGFFTPSEREGHAMFDLPGLTKKRLTDAGVTAENLDICTYADEERFFSYRRTTHRSEPDYGRQISAISIREA
ncbi:MULTISPECIES: peptidoglycan editing factor PgeF [unclassified Rhizobium]|uniref:peptidoglycan editing factor PgeF n=1 Tax=unclassified Rhizobium TaxID=2613769 RepID=UPI000715FBB6|nr:MULTISPECIES: peptidoglycan editing factor PgeF [unclassified Rhizobium]KQS99119.1 polyphenol oxidase [Rhizobium sp. Leaf386]KQT05406.1 polyphenol oxidase [Rhizobium sp. Leaf391]KQT91848.1 polyphenol oxidase [Rhizobium sp. Leaf453]